MLCCNVTKCSFWFHPKRSSVLLGRWGRQSSESGCKHKQPTKRIVSRTVTTRTVTLLHHSKGVHEPATSLGPLRIAIITALHDRRWSQAFYSVECAANRAGDARHDPQGYLPNLVKPPKSLIGWQPVSLDNIFEPWPSLEEVSLC